MSLRTLLLVACSLGLIAACEHDPELGCTGECLDGSASGGASGAGAGGGTSGSGNTAGGAGLVDAGDAAVDAPPPCPFIDPAIVTPAIPCEIDAIMESKCRRCHQDPPVNGAPFPLVTWEHTQGTYLGAPIYDRMENAIATGFMPFVEIIPPLVPPVEDLTPDEKDKMLAWLAECAPPVEATTCP